MKATMFNSNGPRYVRLFILVIDWKLGAFRFELKRERNL